MPLLDHFRPPLSVERPWEGIHSTWAATIATQLNRDLLPADYFAMPLVTVGGRVEVDVATSSQSAASEAENGSVGTLAATWAPPALPLSAAIDLPDQDSYEVQVFQEFGGSKLRAAIELVSPANKDRPAHRHAFAVKAAAYLQRSVSVVLVDVVTERGGNLHGEVVRLLGLDAALFWASPSALYALAYHAIPHRLDIWPEALALGAELPTLPLWLADDLCVPLDLQSSYQETCEALRIRR